MANEEMEDFSIPFRVNTRGHNRHLDLDNPVHGYVRGTDQIDEQAFGPF